MKYFKLLLILLILTAIQIILIPPTQSFAHLGCCSYHGGVRSDGCGCNDGTPLSSTCSPYYTCAQTQPTITTTTNINTNSYSTPAPTSTPTSTNQISPKQSLLGKSTSTPTLSFRPTSPIQQSLKHTPTPLPKTSFNFFSWLFSLFFSPTQKDTIFTSSSQTNAGHTQPNSNCKDHLINPSDPQSYLPDSNCTPGVINPNVTQENIGSTICRSGYTATIRPSVSYTDKLKVEQIKQYGYTDTNTRDYEEDHLISLELGGSPTDPKNLWPEPHGSPNEKDSVENYLRKQVCSHQLTLSQAQKEISQNWYTVYQFIK